MIRNPLYVAAIVCLTALVLRAEAQVRVTKNPTGKHALDLSALVIVDKQSRLDGRPYLKLLAAFLHETLYSGLSVIVGFDYRSAAAAFQDGAERLLASVRETPPRQADSA